MGIIPLWDLSSAKVYKQDVKDEMYEETVLETELTPQNVRSTVNSKLTNIFS